MLALLTLVDIRQPFYFVADAYYASHKIINGLLDHDHHLVTRVKSNAVAYTVDDHPGATKRGRPRIYGNKVKLRSLFSDGQTMQQALSPVYGEGNVTIHFGSVICCGDPLDDWCASWWSFIPPEGAAC